MVAKIYYHLQEYNLSMIFALGAGKLFDLDRGGEFEDTIICEDLRSRFCASCDGLLTDVIAKCVDTYIALSAMRHSSAPETSTQQLPPQLMTAFPQNADGGASTSASLTSPITPFTQSTLPSKSLLSRESTSSTFDPSFTGAQNGGPVGSQPSLSAAQSMQKNLQAVIEQLFERCFQEGRYRQVAGIAIEARNLEVLRRVILRASEDEKRQGHRKNGSGAAGRGEELMEYILDICMSVVQERGLRNEVRAWPDWYKSLVSVSG